jgi:F0F1-type ATP synthase delta subunit
MSVTAIARRYAEALADVAIARNQVEQMDSELRVFSAMIRSNRELYDLVS